MSVLIETTLGDLVVDLFVKERPKSSLNFLKLCKMKYYNLCQFHSIEQNYVAQTGDPTGSGRGGESVFVHMYGEQGRFFEREDLPKMRHTRMGIVSFVNNGENMLGSQFYITLGDGLDYLDAQHTIFGQVTEGLETLEKLNEELCDDDKHPFRDIRIAHTIVLNDPFDDDNRLEFPPRSPSPTYEMLTQSNKIAIDENINEDEGKSAEEIAKEIQDREMAEQAQILEMVGDLRSADEAPPDNVLFVCKLNPVTTDEDLETIFSRFGKIVSCEVIRDRRTHDSLQYAFIEFEEPKSCEQAFYKMDNVLIDDRRIHVDFSQSVAKNYQWDRKENSGPKLHVKKPVKKEYIHQKHVKREYSPRRTDMKSQHNGREIRNRSRERDYRRGDADYKKSRGNSRERRHGLSRSPQRKYQEKRRRSRSGEKRSRRSRSPPRKHSK